MCPSATQCHYSSSTHSCSQWRLWKVSGRSSWRSAPGCWRSPRSCGAGGRCHLRSSGSAPSAPCFQDPGWSYPLGSSSGEIHKNGRLLEVNIKETGNKAMEEVSDRNSDGSASGGQCATSAPTLKLEVLFTLFKLKSILFYKNWSTFHPVFLFYLIELCVLHGGEVESRLPALELQHVIQQLGGRLHVVAIEMRGDIGGAVKHSHNGLGAVAAHPWTVAAQVVVLEGRGAGRERERAGQGKGILSGCGET